MSDHALSQEAEDDFLQAEDEEGDRISDADVIGRGTRPQLVKFRAAGLMHCAELIFSQISFEQRQAEAGFIRRFALENGVTFPIDPDDPEAMQRAEEVQFQASEHQDRLKLRAQIAVAVLARDAQNRARISIPELREGLTPEKLLDNPIYGRRVISALCAEVEDFFSA